MLQVASRHAKYILSLNCIKHKFFKIPIFLNLEKMAQYCGNHSYGQSSHGESSSGGATNDGYFPRPKKHPPHLKGKAIGLYYAGLHKGKGKKGKRDIKKAVLATPISVDTEKEERIHSLFEDIGDQEYETKSSKGYNFNLEYEDHLHDSALRETGLILDQPDNCLMVQDPELDRRLFNELEEKFQLPKYRTMEMVREKLPAYKMKELLVEMIEKNQVLVIVGETGCGKTTQVPQFILNSYIELKKGSLCKIICTQPRRISAISVAERVASERCVPCGNGKDVGFHIRLESEMPREKGSILFCTTGIILQQLQSNPYLIGISHIIVDEVHERNLDSDFLLISLKHILKTRQDLKVILMSATLNAKEFSIYFENCPMVKIPGYTFPVEVFTLEDMIEMTKYCPQNKRKSHTPKLSKKERRLLAERETKKLEYLRVIEEKYSSSTINTLTTWNEDIIDLDLIVATLRHIAYNSKEGAVLIFLPGWAEINKLNNLINDDTFFKSGKFLILTLHSLLPTFNQKLVFEKPPRGTRKIVLATNIAETSITIDDIVYVIDGGKIKMKSFDHENNVQLLQPEWVALSNMKQREGRAGRTQPGICYHMFTKFKELELEPYQQPEMLRTSLEETILKIKILKLGKVVPFLKQAMNPPNLQTVRLSLNNLKRLNALTKDENLTPLGYHLARLPMDPHTGKMILLGAIFSCLDPILSIAASLSFKDAFIIPLGKEEYVDRMKKEISNGSFSDHIAFANAIMEWEVAEANCMGQNYCWEHFLSFSTLKMLINLKKQYGLYLKQLHFINDVNPKRSEYNINSDNILLLKAIICAGLYPNVARVCKRPNVPKHVKFFKGAYLKAITEDNQKVCLHPKSVNATETYIKTGWLAYHMKVKSSDIYLHDTTAVTPYSLLFFGGDLQTSKLKIAKRCKMDIVSVDKWIDFQCDEKKAKLVMCLREELDNLLEYKIKNPGVTDWSPDSREGKVLNCIIELITSEEALETNSLGPETGGQMYD